MHVMDFDYFDVVIGMDLFALLGFTIGGIRLKQLLWCSREERYLLRDFEVYWRVVRISPSFGTKKWSQIRLKERVRVHQSVYIK